ncbi:MAG: outer membrane beta-barrel protein [Bacteroidales bacterium]|nr:outer membrane beta-barrel protein [Bacteroidales bacterium]MBN2697714.1 outer membrane beta-barrel protein [Bacteroidales bacterium]
MSVSILLRNKFKILNPKPGTGNRELSPSEALAKEGGTGNLPCNAADDYRLHRRKIVKNPYLYITIPGNMKKRMIAGILCFLPLVAYGQQNFASISFGTSLPLGDYAATGDLSKNGYARLGPSISFDAAYFPVSYAGISARFGFGSNYGLRDSMMQDMIKHITTKTQNLINIPDEADITYGTGFWNYVNLFVGPHLSARPSQRLYLDLNILAGISIIKPPDHELIILFDDTEIYSRVSNPDLAFGYSAGAGLRYRFNAGIALKLAVDYYQSHTNFNYAFGLFRGAEEEIEPIHSDYSIKALELSAGLAYSF